MSSFLFCESSPNFGGQEHQILVQMDVLQNAGHRSLLACRPSSGIAREAQRRGLPWHPVAFRNSLDPFSILAVLRLLNRHQIDTAFCHSGHDSNVLAVASRLRRKRTMLIRSRTYQPGVPRAASYNRLVDRTFVPSEFLRKKILANPHIHPERIAVVRPILPLESLRREAALPLPAAIASQLNDKSRVVVQAAMLRSEKGHRLALAAMARVRQTIPNLRYVIAGSGSREKDLKNFAAKLGLGDCVIFTGLTLPVAPLLARADLVIMPSLDEPLGLAQLEALALGTPVVVSDAGGLPETVEHGRTGWVLPTNDVDAWTAGLVEALMQSDEARVRAKTGREWVEKTFSAERFLQDLAHHQAQVRPESPGRASLTCRWSAKLAALAHCESEFLALAGPLLI